MNCSEVAEWIWMIEARYVGWSYGSTSKSSFVKAPWERLGSRQQSLASKLGRLCHGLHPILTDSLILNVDGLFSQNRNTS